jgi:hypothetical protein
VGSWSFLTSHVRVLLCMPRTMVAIALADGRLTTKIAWPGWPPCLW